MRFSLQQITQHYKIIVRITSVNFFKQQFTAMGMRDMSVV